MNILRSVVRRGFTVAQAGYFTVTSPNRWFPASRLPGGFQDLTGPPKAKSPTVRDQDPAHHSASHENLSQFELIGLRSQNYPLPRMALIGLAAAALTLAVLWWVTRKTLGW
jgi:hypothetical protein